MNTIYNVVWNSTTGTWVVASEMAKGRKKKSKAASVATTAMLVTTTGLGAGAMLIPTAAMAVTVGATGGYVAADDAATSKVAAVANGAGALAIGPSSQALGLQAAAVGYGAYASGTVNGQATVASAFGSFALAQGLRTTALGHESRATHTGSVALGDSSYTDRDNSVSIGNGNGLTRQLTFVAAGTQDTDAVNVKQLKSAIAASTITPFASPGKYFYVNSTGPDASATGVDSVVIGARAKSAGGNGVAVGDQADAGTTADNTALGAHATATGGYSSATGFESQASGAFSTALGTSATSSGEQSVAIGGGKDRYTGASAVGVKSVALGAGAKASVAGVVALGSDSVADRAGTVSVGSSAATRQIVNVGRGTLGTDAVNVDQLKGVATAVGADLNSDGTVKKPTITVGGNTYDNVSAAIDAVAKGGAAGGSNKYFHTNTALGDSVTQGEDSIAIGGNAISEGKWGTSIGTNSKASGANSVALGNSSLADRANAVSVGHAGNQRQIIYVAPGTADTDAVNVSQLKGTSNSLTAAINAVDAKIGSGGGNSALAVTYDDATKASATLNKGGAAVTLGNVKKGAVSATSADAINGGQLFATAQSVANGLGGGATVNTDGTIKAPDYVVGGSTVHSIGDAVSNIDGRVTNVTNTVNNITNGGGAKYFHTNTTLGDSVTKGDDSIAIGGNADSEGKWGVSIGTNSKASGANSVALGNSALADRDNSVSVGSATVQRQIINVAKGTASTDAVNVAQLKGVATAVGADLNTDGTVKKPTITVGGTTYDNVASAIDAVAKSGPGTGNALAVAYDDATKGLVTLNKGGAAVKITNVATGTEAGDAVNKGQLDTTVAGFSKSIDALQPNTQYSKFGPSTSKEAQATGTDSTAIGGNAFANGNGSLALGLNSRASGANAVAAGMGTLASGDSSLALGSGARAQGANSVALGSGSSVASNESWVVSVGSLTNKRRITNLADGVAASDAATVGQVGKAIDTAFAAKTRSLLTPLAATVTTQAAVSSVPVDQLIAAGPTTLGGQIEASGKDALAIGLNTHATGDAAVSVGQNVNVVSKEGVGVGQNVVVNGLHSVVIGSAVSAIVDDATVFGSGSAVEAAGGVAIGASANVLNTAPNSVAIGRDTQALAAGTVVLGKGSTDDNRANTLSVGSTLGTAVKRQIINVAKGTVGTDAVNVDQLKGVTTAIGGGADVNADGTVKKPTITVGGKTYDTVAAAIDEVAKGSSTGNPLGVAYDDATKAKVTLNKGAGAVTIANVKAGVADDEAVNVAQLKAAGIIDTTGKTIDAVVYDAGSNKGSVSFGGASGTVLKNVAAGKATTDAVNVSQLKGVANALGGGADVNTDGTIKKPSITVGGTTYDTVAGAIDAAAKSSNPLAVSYDDATKAKVTLNKGAGAVTIANVKAGVANDEAVNVAQLKAAGIIDTTGKTIDAVVYDAGSNKGSVSFGGASGTVLKNVGKAVADTDAVNLSQVKPIVAALGGGAKVDPTTGAVTAPTYTLTKPDGTTTPVSTVGDAITNIDGRITNLFSGTAGLVQQSAAGANLTVGKDTDGAAVDFTAKNGATRQLKGITAGVADTDGVNVKQLNDKLTALPSNPNAVSYDDATHTQVTLNKGGAPSKVSNVADATVAGDAVNKGQLDKAISSVSTSVNDIAPKLKYVKFGASVAQDASATGADSMAIGGNAFASNSSSLAIGLNSRAAADKAFAAGAGALAGADSAVALGAGSRAQGANSVALGSGSTVGSSESWVVSVGSLTSKRRITNLADGVANSDAATVGQVGRAIDSALSSKTSRLLSVTTQAAATSSVPVDQLIAAGPTTLGGQIEATGNDALAIGLNTHAKGEHAVSVGQNVNVVSKDGVGVGQNVVVNGVNSVVIGSTVSAVADDAAVFGSNSSVDGVGGVAIGAAAVVDEAGKNSVAIGRNAHALAAGTVVLGMDSTDDNRANTVSVGNTLGDASIKRQIINVAKGTMGSDAVNVDQLKDVAKVVGADLNTDGRVKKPTITVGGTSYDNVAAAIDAVAKNGGGTGNADAVAYDTGSSKATVSFGGASGTVLKNVAAGMVDASSKEAINGSQLYAAGKSVADAIGGGATVGKDGTVSKPSITVGGNNYASVADAIGAVDAKTTTGNTLGVAYDDASKGSITLNKGGSAVTLKNVANATKDDEAVNLAQLKSAGLATDSGTVLDAVAYDAGSSKASISFAGANGTVLNNVADGRIEAGSRQAVNGGQIAAIKDALEGKITNIDNRVTKVEQHGTGGGFTTNGNGGSMIGDQTTASGKDSVAIGNGASITETGNNSVALGNGSVADRADTVSVGSEGHERTISNVADGTAPTDAINLRQLNQSTASANAYTDKMVNDVWSNLSEEIDHSNRQANRGIAAASALINVTPYIPGHVTVNAGVAGYRGESALGVGVSRWSENGRVNLNAGVSAAQGDEAVFRVGIGYIF